MDSEDSLQIVNKMNKEKPFLYKEAVKHTKDMAILEKMYKHPSLSMRMLRSCTEIHTKTNDAFQALKNVHPNSVCIHFVDLELYVIFSYEKYGTFLSGISDDIVDDKVNRSDLKLYQLVVSSQRQKLVIVCTNPVHFDKLKQHAADCFKTNTENTGNEITVNIYANNEQEFSDLFQKLSKYIISKNDQRCIESIMPMPIIFDGYNTYRKYNCSDLPETFDLKDIVSMLKTVSNDELSKLNLTINNNIIVNNNNINGNVNGNVNFNGNNNLSLKDQKIQSTRQWITNNQPNNGELTTAYYERYKAANNNPIISREFGPLVREITKRDVLQGTHGRHW